MTQLILRAAALCVGGAIAAAAATSAMAWEPKGQGECIAPSNPGGGWDMTCRSTSAVLQKTGLFKESIYVTNMPGGSGAVAIANIITKRKGDTNLIVAASNALTFTVALGRTPHTYKDIIPIAQIGAEIGGFFVKDDSKYKTVTDIANAMKADIKSVSFSGGSAPGGQDHMKVALFAKAIGVDPTKVVYVPFQGGGEALDLGARRPHPGRRPRHFGSDRPARGRQDPRPRRPVGKALDQVPRHPDRHRARREGELHRVARLLHGARHPGRRGQRGGPTRSRRWSRRRNGRPKRAKVGMEPITMFGDDFAKFVNKDAEESRALLKELGFVK